MSEAKPKALQTISLEQLDPEQIRELEALPPRELNATHGIALWLNGYSLRGAARESGCPTSTLRLKIERSGTTKDDRAQIADIAVAHASTIEYESFRQLRDALHDGDISPGQLPVVWGIAQDKIARHLTHAKNPDKSDAVADLIAKLHNQGGGKATVSVEVESTRTIDVEPSE